MTAYAGWISLAMTLTSAVGWITLIVTPLYVSVVEVAPDSVSVLAAQAVALAASVTLARASARTFEASELEGTGPTLTLSWPPNQGWMSAV